jgi:DNA repair protein RecN (Recombination protein N)
LEKIEERLFALRAAARKHNVTVAELAPLAETMTAQLGALEDGEAGLRKLGEKAKAARAPYVTAAEAQAVRAPQGRGASRQGGVGRARPAQAREGEVRDRADAAPPEPDWSEAGTDRVQFTVATNPGTPPAPIARIASGGELSRFLLALKVCLAKVGDAATDRVSTRSISASWRHRGSGGRTAEAAGEGRASAGGDPFAAGRRDRRPPLG